MEVKYKQWIAKDGLKQIRKWAEEGLTDKKIAKNIGVRPETFSRWLLTFPQISRVISKARSKKKFSKKKQSRGDNPEHLLELAFKHRVEELGGVAYKLTIKAHNGMPDRMVTFPGSHIAFVEVKRPDGKGYFRDIQKKEISLLKQLGQRVFVLDDYKKIDKLIQVIRRAVQ